MKIEITDEEIDRIVEDYGNKHTCKEWGSIANPGSGFKNGMKYMRDLVNRGEIKAECTRIYSKDFSKKNGYRIRYINRLISRGYEKKHAVETFKAIENDIDYDTTPESAADDEASYWG